MPKPNSAKKPKFKVLQTIKSHKPIVVLFILVMIFPVNYAYSYYKDWDNAQMIKGLAKDFPALVAEIESATGLDLEIKTDCSITQEKFSEGVKTCEIVGISENKYITDEGGEKIIGEKSDLSNVPSEANLIQAEDVVVGSKIFPRTVEFQNGEGYKASYRSNNSCSFSTKNGASIYLSCITAVNEANIELARKEFKLK